MAGVAGSATVSGGGTVTLSPAATAVNSDGPDLTSATIAITGGGTGVDVLSANTGGTAITMSYSSVSRTLTLSGRTRRAISMRCSER